MAPTLYHYIPAYMDDNLKPMLENHKLSLVVKTLLALIMVILIVTLIIFIVRVNSKACKDGLRAEQECRNFTDLLNHQLTQAQEVLLKTETQAANCNQTVVTLTASLEMEKAQVQQLQAEIEKLKQNLQETSKELKQLRKENEASRRKNDSTSSGNTISPLVVSVLLTLSLGALLA